MYVFCNFFTCAVVQTIFQFQYQIQFQGDENRSIFVHDQNPLVDQDGLMRKSLEYASQMVLMDDLGCSDEEGQETFGRKLRGVQSADEGVIQNRRKRSADRTEDSLPQSAEPRQQFQRRNVDVLGNQRCGFTVKARIDRWHEMQCLSSVHAVEDNDPEEIVCLLVFSEVKVTAVSLFQELSQEELRPLVASAMMEAMLGDEFKKFLASENLIGSG